MLFRRKRQLGPGERLRHAVWPRKGWLRPFLYHAKCTLRLADNAHAIAIGVACGAFASFTPLMGLHIVIACALAWLLSGNLVAAAIGTAVGNPFTFPPIWLATHRLGSFILDRGSYGESVAGDLGTVFMRHEGPIHHFFIAMWKPVIWPMTVGGIPLGLLVGAMVYFVSRSSVEAFQAARIRRRHAATRSPASLDGPASA